MALLQGFPEADVLVKCCFRPVKEAHKREVEAGQNHHERNDFLDEGVVHVGLVLCGCVVLVVIGPQKQKKTEGFLHDLKLLSCMK